MPAERSARGEEKLADLQPAAGALRPESAAEIIGRKIVSGHFAPGTTLPNLDQLAEEFSMSRLSVREAIRMLAGSGQPLGQISANLGFAAPSSFTRFFKERVGFTPSHLRRRVEQSFF